MVKFEDNTSRNKNVMINVKVFGWLYMIFKKQNKKNQTKRYLVDLSSFQLFKTPYKTINYVKKFLHIII